MKTGIALMVLVSAALAHAQNTAGEQRIAVAFDGGHETVGVDRGRPVVLVAGALGVKPEVFRDAFSRVHPARRDGGSTPDEAQANKRALMDALGKYGITNDRLDEVSNHYRYRREKGEMWPVRPAKAFAIVRDGKLLRFEVTDGGEGYSSAPTVRVPGFPNLTGTPILSFDKRFERNGAVKSIAVRS